MNKKNKIIVSIVGITLVLLALLGITYAYYLTRIEGNTNTNSISITTADLKLVYGDGNGHVSKENIMPGTTIEKTFTVTNSGNNKVDNYAVYLEELVNTLSRTEDLTYVLECTSTSGSCNGNSGQFPQLARIIATNSIDTGVTHTYKLTVTYINHETIDQSIDMGSTIKGFVQIYAMSDVIDIEGSIIGASEGDYAQINNVQKRSQIVEGKYKFAGVLPGTHTIKICGKTDTNCTTPKLTKEIVVKVGTPSGVSGNVVTMTDDSQTATIDIDLTSETKVIISSTVKDYNPFEEGTLAYSIYKNAQGVTDEQMKNEGIAKLTSPLSEPGKQSSLGVFKETVLDEKNYTLDLVYKAHYSDLNFDSAEDGVYFYETYGKYPSSCSEWLGWWVVITCNTGDTECEEAANIIQQTGTFTCDGDYAVFDYKKTINESYSYDEYKDKESTLSQTVDSNGVTYYYRGGVENNFVNFSGMCWRIVRINGDGTIKIILADREKECDDMSYSLGNNSSGYIIDVQKRVKEQSTHSINSINFNNTIYHTALSAFVNGGVTQYTFEDSVTFEKKIDDTKLGVTKWCDDISISNRNWWADESYGVYEYYFGASSRESNPSLKCDFKSKSGLGGSDSYEYESTFGLLTADELMFAGQKSGNDNKSYYLYNNANEIEWLTMSPGYFEEEHMIMDYYTNLVSPSAIWDNPNNYSLRPAVALKRNITATTKTDISTYGLPGTKNNPYVIN